MIVAGTSRHGRAVGIFVGSVAQRLLRMARCPVLAVPPSDRTSPSPLHRVPRWRHWVRHQRLVPW
ncbi:MAG: universal stress protein [Candidatus Dormibacteraeota bacterium]|uniref:Universal stress protein n=1 Tax=Candidatus Aeolococcus gillhamiae TaxID=3127015 RepID=A0A2W6AIS5_9BACT|nr:universal stress protein [Candidatus Dormibacteraeota bacterium]PZR83494.1 MAG: hypothetical protein DLM65_01775 [Candidatus Dormibacter sp. RRmetagenome_bin12]